MLGTPSTVATVNGEAFYYISQRTARPVMFMDQKVVDQRVIAVYFDKNRQVERLANYGLKDGKIFDFISRTTPTGGHELSYLRRMFKLQLHSSVDAARRCPAESCGHSENIARARNADAKSPAA